MMRGKGFVTVLMLALAVLIYLVVVRPLLISDEARIRKGIEEGIQDIEAKDLAKCLRHVSLHYKDEYGLTYVGVRELLGRIFQEFDAFEVGLGDLRFLSLEKEQASLSLDLTVKVRYRGEKAYLLGSGEDANRVNMRFIKEGRRWKVIQVEGIQAHGFEGELPRVVRRWWSNTA
jgi:hypothetical protein